LTAAADNGCVTRFPGFVGTSVRRSSLSVVYLVPSQRSWSFGDRKIVCFVESHTAVTGTLRNSRS
jgi:hypothetical protein